MIRVVLRWAPQGRGHAMSPAAAIVGPPPAAASGIGAASTAATRAEAMERGIERRKVGSFSRGRGR
jgi:hypothetical protein